MMWYGPYQTYLFKSLYKFALKNNIMIDKSVKTLVESFDGEAEHWKPSVKIIHNRIYVSGITESMLSFLDDIDSTDLSVRNIEEFTKLGLAVPAGYEDIEDFMDVSFKNHIKMTSSDDILRLLSYVKQSGRKVLVITGGTGWTWASSNDNYILSILRDNVNLKVVDRQEVRYTDPDPMVDTVISTVPLDMLMREQNSLGAIALAAEKVIYIAA